MIKKDFGKRYLEVAPAQIVLTKSFSVKATRFGFKVFETHSGDTFEIFPTKLRAYYVATLLNGKDVSNFFNFGTHMFSNKE